MSGNRSPERSIVPASERALARTSSALAERGLALVKELALSKRVRARESSITYEGGSGDTIQDAIVIRGAHNGAAGVHAEYRYIRQELQRLGIGGEMKFQSLLKEGDRYFDAITIALSDGTERVFHFDITEFFGK